MLKKLITVALSLFLISSISVMAENTKNVTDDNAAGESQQMPQGESPQGVRGDMGMPPGRGMQGGTPPDMPNGKIPQGDFAPPEGLTPPEGFTPTEGLAPQQEKSAPLQNAGEVASPESSKNNAETVTPPANENVTTENQQAKGNGEESNQTQDKNQQFGGQMPGGMDIFSGNMQNFNGQTQEVAPKGFSGFIKTYSTPIISVILLGLAFIFVIFYRRKNY